MTVAQLVGFIEQPLDLSARFLVRHVRQHTHRHRVFLTDVAHIRGPFENDAVGRDAGAFEGLTAFSFEFLELRLQLVHFEIVQAREKCLYIIAPKIGHQHAERGKMSRSVRDDDLANRKLLGDRGRVERSAAAIRDEGEVARIQASLQRYAAHGVGHRSRGDFEHAGCGAFQFHSQGLGDALAKSNLGRLSVEAHFAAEEPLG